MKRRLKSADLKNEFFLFISTVFLVTLIQGKAADYHMLFRMIGEMKGISLLV